MDGAKEDLVDMFIVHTTEEIQVSGAIQMGATNGILLSNSTLHQECSRRYIIEKATTKSNYSQIEQALHFNI